MADGTEGTGTDSNTDKDSFLDYTVITTLEFAIILAYVCKGGRWTWWFGVNPSFKMNDSVKMTV